MISYLCFIRPMHNFYMLRDSNNTINTNEFHYPEGLSAEFRYATHVIHINVICTQNVKSIRVIRILIINGLVVYIGCTWMDIYGRKNVRRAMELVDTVLSIESCFLRFVG